MKRFVLLGSCLLGVCSLLTFCVRDSRTHLERARTGETARPSGLFAQSRSLCSLAGPRNHTPGIYGTDLGFTARRPEDKRLSMLFGDTWVKAVDACRYPSTKNDDFQAYLPLERPTRWAQHKSDDTAAVSCELLQYEQADANDPASWRRIRLFPNAQDHRDEAALDTSMLRTPAAAFSDGQRLFTIYYRNEPQLCTHSSECPSTMACSSEQTPKLGQCSTLVKLAEDTPPEFCRDTKDCAVGTTCEPAQRGVCLADKPFRLRPVNQPSQSIVPTWYRDDPRRAIARTLYIAAALWPAQPSDYGTVARFATNHFQNIAVRSVAYFDADHPEKNDYRPGYHTLLIWGRPSFFEHGGAQSLPFFAYVPLAELRTEPEVMRFQPRYFAGYGDSGGPAWSTNESDAQPIYGTEAQLVDTQKQGAKLAWREPEFDYVEWATVSYVAPLRRFLMLYGGDLPAFMVLDPQTGKAREPTHLQFAPGAIHMRSAAHPWGSLRKADAGEWSSAEPILTRQTIASYLACGARGEAGLPGCVKEGDPHSPLDLVATLAGYASRTTPGKFADVAASCVGGEFAFSVQNAISGDLVGRLYAPNIIDEWTEDLTPPERAQQGPRSAEIYWNVSTWNPYQVVLVKSRIDER